MPQKTVLGKVRRSDDKRKYFLSGHIDLPLRVVRPDLKLETDGTDASELMVVILDLVGYQGAIKRAKKFADIMGLPMESLEPGETKTIKEAEKQKSFVEQAKEQTIKKSKKAKKA